ncbi:iron-containing redox enzyme family protein [Pseudomonas asplenii]|uniref:iron-containing redox enzyme family protein n=1 Tax=Pseudomonas asplenii TaxID=53407 RepID=UPI00039A7268|nr:iron-containing redox enzyme family protein [Pseudomonas fuscovaginae]
MDKMSERIRSLAESVTTHPALNNDFYERWMGSALGIHDLEIFARNYWSRTFNTATMVARSLIHASHLSAKVEIAKNLFSEFGYGHMDKAHIVLLQNFLLDLLSRANGRAYSMADLEKVPVLATTEHFIQAQLGLYQGEGQPGGSLRVLGALLAQEWLAYSMLTRLYEGARNYKFLYACDDDFHEHCEYFYVHIADAEKDHKEQAIKAAALECETPEDFEYLSTAFSSFLHITELYWRGIARAMSAPSER